MMRRYSRLRSSTSAKSRERDTYLFQDAEESAQNAEATTSKICSKSTEKPENAGLGKHFMASIWKVASLKEKLHRSQSSAAEISAPTMANSDETENISELPGFQHDTLRRAISLTDPPTFTRLAADHYSPADSRKASAAADAHPTLVRSTSARDSSLEVSVNEGSLGAAVHRALSVREGRLKPVDGQNPASVKDKQIRIVLNSNAAPACGFLAGESHPKEQIKQSASSEQKISCRSSENFQKSQAPEKDQKNEATKSHEGAEQNQALNQKTVKKTQSMRCSLIATDVEEAWVPARNSSYFGPISLQKGSIFGGFDGVNLSYTYSAIDGEAGSLNCSVCGCEIGSVVHGVKSGNDYADLCNSCYTLHTASDQFDPPKVLKKKGGLIKACRRILHLSKKSSFS